MWIISTREAVKAGLSACDYQCNVSRKRLRVRRAKRLRKPFTDNQQRQLLALRLTGWRAA